MLTQKEREFVNKITIKLTKYEDERKKRITKLIVKEIIALVIAYLSGSGFLFFGSKDETAWLTIVCGLVMLFAIIYFFMNIFDSNKDFKQYLKQRCRKDILKTFNLETMKGLEFSEEELVKSNLFSTFNQMEHDDVIQGKYNDVDYTIAETKLIHVGRRSEFTAFKGVIISFKSNKKIAAETLVTTKGDTNIRNYPTCGKFLIYRFIGWLLILSIILAPFVFDFMERVINSGLDIVPAIIKFAFNEMIGFIPIVLSIFVVLYMFYVQKKKMQDVKLEATAFEKRFNVYTKDQVEARYLLTPAFMDRLQNLETAFGTRKIKCSFFDDQIMFAIPTRRDLFELGCLYKPLSSNSDIENFYKELTSIQQMIDHFKLDQKTGL